MKSTIIFLLLTCVTLSAVAQEMTKPDNSTSELVYSMAGLDVVPEFPGKGNAFQSEVMRSFKVPETDVDLDAKLFVEFIIENDGSVSNIKCMRDPGFGLCAAARNAITAVKTKWKPGIKNGIPVRVKYLLPISVKLKRDAEPVKEE